MDTIPTPPPIQPAPVPPRRRGFGCLAAALFVLLCFSLLVNLLFVGFRKAGSMKHLASDLPEFEEQTIADGTGKEKIAVVSLNGIISSSIAGSVTDTMVDDIKTQLRQAVEDKEVKAIVLNIDSPGGEVTASDVIYAAVTKAREKKPVVVYMGSVAASGGYYIACGGTYLMANETTITGSIGVIIQTMNYESLLGKVGVQSVVFKSGKMKDLLSGSRPMTEEERAYVQNLITQTYEKFVGIVARERHLPVEDLKSGIADGRIISGKDAVDLKLINAVGQVEDAYEKAKELGDAKNASVMKYESPFHLGKLLRIFGKSRSSKIEIKLPQQLVPQELERGKMYLLPSLFAL